MKIAMCLETSRLVLNADTAAELMTADPVSIDQNATVKEAAALFTDKGFNVAPVIDRAGRPIGVLSCSDIVVHDREKIDYLTTEPTEPAPTTKDGERLGRGFLVEKTDRTRVRDMMTPTVFAVSLETPAAEVIANILQLGVHHLFVVDGDGVLVGVISTLDVLRKMGP